MAINLTRFLCLSSKREKEEERKKEEKRKKDEACSKKFMNKARS